MKTKIKAIFLVSILFLITLCGNVNAQMQYYTGEKSNHERKETYLHGITEEMCTSEYWKNKAFMPIDEVLMNYNEVDELNKKIVDGSGTMVFDLETMNTFNAETRKNGLSSAAIPTRDLYIKGIKINNEEYFSKILTAIKETGYTGENQEVKYGVCSGRADLKDWPTDDIIGYSPTDTDDEMQSSAMNLNEPFIIQAKCVIDGKTFYWGYSTNCTGWVNAKNIALCETKKEWLDYWKVKTNANDFVVVTGSRINLKKPNSDDVSMMLGTVVKLVPYNEIPADLANQANNNYIVYFAGVDDQGNATREYAVLNKSLEVHQGFLKLTQSNVLDIAFSCIGDAYGWGGMNGNMDCSLYTRYIYRCFGFELPRNTTWQEKIPEKYKNISGMTDEEKIQYVSTLPTGSLLYISGHTMVYIGMDENKNFVVSDLGTVVDEVGDLVPESVYAVTVNSLDVRRGASYGGTTWLHNLTGAIAFVDPIDISKCDITIENSSYIYDGEEKKPTVNVLYNGKPLYQGINFKVSYSNNIEEGTAIVEISGINSFNGKTMKNFEIKKQSGENENQGENQNQGDNGNSGEEPKTPEESSESENSATVTDTEKKDDDGILDKFINTIKTGANHSLTWVIVAIIILTIIAIKITLIKNKKGREYNEK